ncbi:MAG TPA: hypothetical protein VEX41_06845 [Candidatus Eisenbacteria bacterium]|nr:hypothetical protein [Candidatus Eisenbacteria bacterium]
MDRSARSYRMAAGAFTALAILVSACAAQTGGGATPAASQAPGSTASATGAAGGAPEVQIGHDAKLGDYLTGEGGKTLYLLTKDTPGVSTCVDACAATWLPFTVETGESVQAGSGVTGALATAKRPDGSMQVTYNGRPLYYFAADGAAGDANGQGVNDVWFVVSPAGEPGGAGASPPASDGGYSY